MATMASPKSSGDSWSAATWRWLVTFQISPTQPTAKLSPAFALVRLSRIWVFCYMLGHMIPVGEVSECVTGVEQFVNAVEFQRPDQLDESGTEFSSGVTVDRVATLDDAVLFSKALVAALLPSHSYEGPREHPEYVLRVHRLVNSVVMTQRRVSATSCAYATEPEFQSLYPKCYLDWPEWETTTDKVSGMEWSNTARGFVTNLPLDHDGALAKVNSLERHRVYDRATREISVGFAFHNAPGHFTGFCVVSFKISPYGKVDHNIDTEFLRLHPYAAEVAGGHLASGQLLFLVLFLVITAEITYVAKSQPNTRWTLAYLLRPWCLYDFFHSFLVLWGVWLWYEYIMHPARVDYDPHRKGFQDVAQLARAFSTVVLVTSFALFFSVIRMVEYLICLHPELSKIYSVLSVAIADLGIFLVIFVTMFGGFVVSGYFLFGQAVYIFSSHDLAAYNLLLWFLALGGGMRALLEQPGGPFFLILFLMICMVLLFNMFTAIILTALDKKDEISYDVGAISSRAWNHRVADWVADKLGWPESNITSSPHKRSEADEERDRLLPSP